LNVSQLKNALETAAEIYRSNGNLRAAYALTELASLCAGYETKNVSAFTATLTKALDKIERQ
jgi:hypothetical protein